MATLKDNYETLIDAIMTSVDKKLAESVFELSDEDKARILNAATLNDLKKYVSKSLLSTRLQEIEADLRNALRTIIDQEFAEEIAAAATVVVETALSNYY